MSGSSVSVLLHNLWFLGLEKSTLILGDDFRIDLFSNRHHTYSIFCISLDKRFTHHLLALQSELTSLQKFCFWVTLGRHVCSHTLFVCSVQASPLLLPLHLRLLAQKTQHSETITTGFSEMNRVCLAALLASPLLAVYRMFVNPQPELQRFFFQPRMLLQSYLLPLCFENTFPFAWILKLKSGKESVASFLGGVLLVSPYQYWYY